MPFDYGDIERRLGSGIFDLGEWLAKEAKNQIVPPGLINDAPSAAPGRPHLNAPASGAASQVHSVETEPPATGDSRDYIEQLLARVPSSKSGSLKFAWGGAKPQEVEFGDDLRSGRFGEAPDMDSVLRNPLPNQPDVQAHESVGRGGFSPSAVGSNASAAEWESRVANPEAFSTYRNLPERKLRDVLSQDPFAEERAKAQIGVGAGLALAQGKAGIEQGNILDRYARYKDIDARESKDLQALRSTPQYARGTPDERATAEAKIKAAYDGERSNLDRSVGKITVSERAGGGFGG